MHKIQRVLFVCTGNSCRSVMAAGFMKAKLLEKGITDAEVESAGIAAPNGLKATPETIQVMSEKKIDVSSHESKLLTKEMIEKADLILVMGEIHLDEVLYKVPQAKEKVFLLKSYGVGAGLKPAPTEIPDPIGKPMEVYEVCRNTIEQAVDRVIEKEFS